MTKSVPLFRIGCAMLVAQIGFVLLRGDTPPPVIRGQSGVVSAANYAPPDFPGGGIAQGGIFTIFGSNIGPGSLVNATSYPLQTALGGVTVDVTQGATTVHALPLWVYATQLAAIMPSNAPVGSVQVTVTYNGVTSAPATAQVANTNVALFTVPSSGMGPGAIQNYVDGPLPINSLTSPAKPGQVVILWSTGLGASLNGDDTGVPQAGSFPFPVNVLVGGKQLATGYAGRSGCCAGEDEIVFTIPTDNPPLGCHVPVQVLSLQGTPSNVATMAISPDGGPCTDNVNPFGTAPLAGKNGVVLLAHTAATVGSGAVALSATADALGASFHQETGGQFAFSPLYSLPPVGTCTVYLGTADTPGDSLPLPSLSPTGAALNAGTLNVSNGTSTEAVPFVGGFYSDLLAYSADLAGPLPPFLTGGAYTISSPGGADVGPFSVSLTDPPAVTLAIRGGSTVVTRSAGVTVDWDITTGDPTKFLALIAGANTDTVDDRTAGFLCTANAADGTFKVPQQILSRLPATRAAVGLNQGVVAVGLLPLQPQAPFSAPGLDQAFADSVGLSAQIVTFQ